MSLVSATNGGVNDSNRFPCQRIHFSSDRNNRIGIRFDSYRTKQAVNIIYHVQKRVRNETSVARIFFRRFFLRGFTAPLCRLATKYGQRMHDMVQRAEIKVSPVASFLFRNKHVAKTTSSFATMAGRGRMVFPAPAATPTRSASRKVAFLCVAVRGN